MTPQEFKAWFEGYAEGIDKTPSDKQWKRIKARVSEIDGRATDRTVFVDRYWPYQRDWWMSANLPRLMPAGTLPPQCVASGSVRSDGSLASYSVLVGDAASSNYDPATAFNALGRADALADS